MDGGIGVEGVDTRQQGVFGEIRVVFLEDGVETGFLAGLVIVVTFMSSPIVPVICPVFAINH